MALCPTTENDVSGVRVDGDRIFLSDTGVWTSAGLTAGIDMVLALIEEDLGNELPAPSPECSLSTIDVPAVSINTRCCLILIRRPTEFEKLCDLHGSTYRLSVERLAEVAHLSVRQFGRTFVASTGLTPAKAIERLRVEVARPRIEDGRETFDAIALAVGFADPERMRQSFIRILGHTPQELRRLARTGKCRGNHEMEI